MRAVRRLLWHWLLFTGALGITAWLLPDRWMRLEGVLPAFLAALLLGLLNALVRPLLFLLKLITLPLSCLTLGLFALVVSFVMNALLLWLVGSGWVNGFQVPTFTGALVGAIILGVVNGVLSVLLGRSRSALWRG